MIVSASTQAFIDTLDLDAVGIVRAQIALSLAAKLDQAVDPKTLSVSQLRPQVSPGR